MAPTSNMGGRVPCRGGHRGGRGRGQVASQNRGGALEEARRLVSRTQPGLQNRGGRLPNRGGRQGKESGRPPQSGRGGGRRVEVVNEAANNATTSNKAQSNQPLSPWRNSKAKAKLEKLLKDEDSYVQLLTPQQVCRSDTDFEKYGERFVPNYRNLKARIEGEKKSVDFDKDSLEHDRALHPKKDTNKRGEARYEGSAAEKWMKENVKENKTKGMTPTMLLDAVPELRSLTKKQLRSHKHREERHVHEGVHWQKKRNDKARKKYEKEVQERNDN